MDLCTNPHTAPTHPHRVTHLPYTSLHTLAHVCTHVHLSSCTPACTHPPKYMNMYTSMHTWLPTRPPAHTHTLQTWVGQRLTHTHPSAVHDWPGTRIRNVPSAVLAVHGRHRCPRWAGTWYMWFGPTLHQGSNSFRPRPTHMRKQDTRRALPISFLHTQHFTVAESLDLIGAL